MTVCLNISKMFLTWLRLVGLYDEANSGGLFGLKIRIIVKSFR